MGKIPFEQQRLHQTALQYLQSERSLGHSLHGEDLRRAVEEATGKELSPELRDLFCDFTAPARKPLGRRPNNRGQEDFVLEQIDRIYPWLLARYQKKGDCAPSEKAYRFLADRASKLLKNIDGATLRNKHSKWRRGGFHSLEHCADSEDYEAAIDEQFPPQRCSQ